MVTHNLLIDFFQISLQNFVQKALGPPTFLHMLYLLSGLKSAYLLFM